MASKDNESDLTVKILELTKENEELRTKIGAYESAAKTSAEEMAKKDANIAKLNKILVDRLLSDTDPNQKHGEDTEKTPNDIYAETLKEMSKSDKS